MTDTKNRILDTAERLFADRGYSATSLRNITSEAGVNLAAVHYHFHSKEALLGAVVKRRIEPINQERLALLGQCERTAGENPPPLDKVLEALLAPMFKVACDPALGGAVFVRLMGRIHAEGDLLPKIMVTLLAPILTRFSQALRRSLPNLPAEELFWRMHFAIGAVFHTLRGSQELTVISGGLCNSSEPSAILDRLVGFLSAGFGAPVQAAAAQEE